MATSRRYPNLAGRGFVVSRVQGTPLVMAERSQKVVPYIGEHGLKATPAADMTEA